MLLLICLLKNLLLNILLISLILLHLSALDLRHPLIIFLNLLIGQKKVQSLELKIKDNVDHAGLSPPLAL